MTAQHDPQDAGAPETYLDSLDALDIAENAEQGFLSATIRFRDSSQWKLAQAVLRIAYQQGQPPCEARQVFKAVCVLDSESI